MLDLKTRLFEWMSIPRAVYELGAYLGFWEEFGHTFGGSLFQDPWHGHKEEILTSTQISNTLFNLLNAMMEKDLIEINENKKVRWKKKKK
jgi:hypothetical protein